MENKVIYCLKASDTALSLKKRGKKTDYYLDALSCCNICKHLQNFYTSLKSIFVAHKINIFLIYKNAVKIRQKYQSSVFYWIWSISETNLSLVVIRKKI